MRTFQGESHVINVTIKDSEGNIINPSLSTITNIEARLVHRIKGIATTKWSRNVQQGFTTMEIVEDTIKLYCNESVLKKRETGQYDIEIKVITANSKMAGGDVQISKAPLFALNPASNG